MTTLDLSDPLAAARAVQPEQLTTLTPPQLDVMFAAVDEEYASIGQHLGGAWDRLYRAVGVKKTYIGRRERWELRRDQVEEKAHEIIAEGIGVEEYRRGISKALAAIKAYQDRMYALNQGPTRVLNGEWNTRGGWNRAYLAKSDDGHVHNTMRCPSCNRGEEPTRFEWMIDYSGRDETEIVEAAAARACTICYPSAPVEVLDRPTRMFSRDEIAKQKAREEREVKKAEAAAKKAAKAITTPEGEPLRIFDRHIPARAVRVRGVVKTYEAYDKYETIETLHAARGWLTDTHEGWRSARRPEDVQHVAEAIATKEGKTVEQVIDEAKARAAKRK